MSKAIMKNADSRKKKEGRSMKHLCFELADEIVDFVLDMEGIPLSEEEYEKNFDDVQEKLMDDPDLIINYLMDCNFPPMELIEKIKQF